MGLYIYLDEGKENVLSEVNLIMLCYNLRRLMSILDPKVLKERLKGLGLELSTLFETVLALMGNFLFLKILPCHSITTNKTSTTTP
ncbi:MAG: hypothetical protein KJO94_05190 [Eudoraea sp.]|nr:hypothetical protein [Eudoraea sp.]